MAKHGYINDIPGLVATGNLASHQYKVVKFGSTAGTVKVVSATTDVAIGILMNDPTSGQPARVAGPGSVAIGLAGVADLAEGELVGYNSTGQIADHTTAGRFIIGQALQASTAANDEVMVVLTVPHGYA